MAAAQSQVAAPAAAAHSCSRDGMCEHQRSVLRDNRVYMQENIYADDNLLSHLLAKGLLSANIHDEINAEAKTKRINKILDILPTRGPKAFDAFCDALCENYHDHVANKLLREEKAVHDLVKINPNIRSQEHVHEEILHLTKDNKILKRKYDDIQLECEKLAKDERKATKLWRMACDVMQRMSKKIAKDPLQSDYFPREQRALQKAKETYRKEPSCVTYLSDVQSVLEFMETVCRENKRQKADIIAHEELCECLKETINRVNMKIYERRPNDIIVCGSNVIGNKLAGLLESGLEIIWDECLELDKTIDDLKVDIDNLNRNLKDMAEKCVSSPSQILSKELDATLTGDDQLAATRQKIRKRRVMKFKDSLEEIDDYLKDHEKKHQMQNQISRLTSRYSSRNETPSQSNKSEFPVSPDHTDSESEDESQSGKSKMMMKQAGPSLTVTKPSLRVREPQTVASKSSSSEGTADDLKTKKQEPLGVVNEQHLEHINARLHDRDDVELKRDSPVDMHQRRDDTTPEHDSNATNSETLPNVKESVVKPKLVEQVLVDCSLNYTQSFAPRGLGKQRLLKRGSVKRDPQLTFSEIAIDPETDTAKSYQMVHHKGKDASPERVSGERTMTKSARAKKNEQSSSQKEKKLIFLSKDDKPSVERLSARTKTRQGKSGRGATVRGVSPSVRSSGFGTQLLTQR